MNQGTFTSFLPLSLLEAVESFWEVAPGQLSTSAEQVLRWEWSIEWWEETVEGRRVLLKASNYVGVLLLFVEEGRTVPRKEQLFLCKHPQSFTWTNLKNDDAAPRTISIHLALKSGVKGGVIAHVFKYILNHRSCSMSVSNVPFPQLLHIYSNVYCTFRIYSFKCSFLRNKGYHVFWAWSRTCGPIEKWKRAAMTDVFQNNSLCRSASSGLTSK